MEAVQSKLPGPWVVHSLAGAAMLEKDWTSSHADH